MKSLNANSFCAILAATVTGLALLASLARVAAQPASENKQPTARPEFYYIQGEVNLPQRYIYTNGLTLTAAVKRAKGMTDQASSAKVSLVRIGEKPRVVDWQAIEHGKAKDIELKPGDKVVVPRK